MKARASTALVIDRLLTFAGTRNALGLLRAYTGALDDWVHYAGGDVTTKEAREVAGAA